MIKPYNLLKNHTIYLKILYLYIIMYLQKNKFIFYFKLFYKLIFIYNQIIFFKIIAYFIQFILVIKKYKINNKKLFNFNKKFFIIKLILFLEKD